MSTNNNYLWDSEVIALSKMFDENTGQEILCEDKDPLFDDEPGERLLMLFLGAKSPKDMKALFKGMFSERQIAQMKKNLAAARLLAGGVKYASIQEKYKITPRTLSKLAKKLKTIPGFLSPTFEEEE